MTIAGPWLERYVTDQVLDYIDSDRLQEAIKRRRKTGKSRKASEIEARLELLDTQHVDGKVSKARFDRMNGCPTRWASGSPEDRAAARGRPARRASPQPEPQVGRYARLNPTQDHRCRGGVADSLRGHQPRSDRPQPSWDHLAVVTRRRVVRESSSAHLLTFSP